MKANFNMLKRGLKRGIPFLSGVIISAIFASPVLAQAELYGPQNPPPKPNSITCTGSENDGEIGRTGGKVYTISNITLSNTTTVYYTMLADTVKLSMDGSTYTGAENMAVDPGLTDLPGGIVVWTGATIIPIANDNGIGIKTYRPLVSKFIMTVFDLDSNPVSLTEPGTTGLHAQTGGAVLITGYDMVFKVRMEMLVSDDGGSTYTPHLDYYDAAQTLPGTESAYSTYTYGFYWENDPPELITNLPANVDEGDTVVISNTLLAAEDVESSRDEIYFVFDPLAEGLLPAHGKIWSSVEEIVLPDTFSMSTISSGYISYVHNGSESIIDSIPLMLFDGDSAKYMIGEDSVFYFMFNITPVDDPPTLTLNTGAVVDEDSALIITSEMLMTTDPESSAGLITYTLDPEANSDYPEHGMLKLNDIPLGDGSTFTQDDINNGNLVYDHDGSETLSDGFVFQVTDEYGHLATIDNNTIFFFDITVNAINDVPLLTKNITMEIDEGGTGIVSNALIAASDAESGPEDITFTLDPNFDIEQPNHGVLFLDAVELGDGDSFTMADVNNNLVTYQHDGGEGTNDFFAFNVSDPHGGIAHDGEYTIFQFIITITPVNDPPTLANPIDDQEIRAEQLYSFTFPENTFMDEDEGDQLTYTAKRVGDLDLPGWLTFDGSARTFSGTPQVTDKGDLYIVIKAQDIAMAEALDTFMLDVIGAVGITNSHVFDGLIIYPNPFTYQFTISISESIRSAVRVEILNLLGESIAEFVEKPGTKRTIDMVNQPSGIYFIKVDDGKNVYSRKLLKR